MGRHSMEAAGDTGEQRELSPAAQLLVDRGLGHLLDAQIVNYHDGGVTTIADALACEPFANGVNAMNTALPDEQFGPTMEAYVARMAPPAEGAV